MIVNLDSKIQAIGEVLGSKTLWLFVIVQNVLKTTKPNAEYARDNPLFIYY